MPQTIQQKLQRIASEVPEARLIANALLRRHADDLNEVMGARKFYGPLDGSKNKNYGPPYKNKYNWDPKNRGKGKCFYETRDPKDRCYTTTNGGPGGAKPSTGPAGKDKSEQRQKYNKKYRQQRLKKKKADMQKAPIPRLAESTARVAPAQRLAMLEQEMRSLHTSQGRTARTISLFDAETGGRADFDENEIIFSIKQTNHGVSDADTSERDFRVVKLKAKDHVRRKGEFESVYTSFRAAQRGIQEWVREVNRGGYDQGYHLASSRSAQSTPHAAKREIQMHAQDLQKKARQAQRFAMLEQQLRSLRASKAAR